MKILLAAPRGFCAGVNMAVESVERALEIYGPPLFVYHEIIHNNWIVAQFERQGVVFVDDLLDVPAGSHLMFSAHGVSPEIRAQAKQRQLSTIDATCPLVRKVHDEAARFAEQGFTIFLIGHSGHDEVVGTLGVAPEQIRIVENVEAIGTIQVPDPDKTAYLMQTTLSVDDALLVVDRLRERFPNIQGPPKNDICYATQNRQAAIRTLAQRADIVLIVGSRSSSNSVRLTEVAQANHCRAYLIDGPGDLCEDWFAGNETVLVSAGASAPELLVQQTLKRLTDRFDASIEEVTLANEQVTFPLPVELQPRKTSATLESGLTVLNSPVG